MLGAVGQVQALIHAGFDFQGRMTLDGDSVFADVHDLMQIEHRAFGFRRETGVGRSLDLVSHTAATVG